MTKKASDYFNSGTKLFEKGYFERAQSDFRVCIKIAPDLFEAYLGYSASLLAAAKFQEA
jgi:hypothetical protein